MPALKRMIAALYSAPFVMLSLTALFWGGNAVAGRLAVDHVSPLLLTFMR